MPLIFGASNASRDQAKIWGLLESYNENAPEAERVNLKHMAHSLGVSSTKNAMNWANHQNMKFDNTYFDANTVGTSYPMTNTTLGSKFTLGVYNQGYTEKASELFKEGKIEYAVAPRDLVGTGMGLPFLPGRFSLGIGNTDTTGSNTAGIPLWGIIAGDHTKAYYKDERVIDFLHPGDKSQGVENKEAISIKNYQNNIWEQIGSKTKEIEFSNGKTLQDYKRSK